MASTRSPTLLIDGDILIYKAAMAAETDWDWGGGLWTRWGVLDEAVARLKSILNEWMARLDTEKVLMCLSCPTHRYWRHDIFPDYKGHRTSDRRPVLLKPLRAYVEEHYECKVKPNLEADDLLGIIATHRSIVSGPKIVVSEDKDLKSIPGKLYNPRTDELNTISIDAADAWHMYQTLIGDSTDGYKGCPGIGPKRAEGITTWGGVAECFRKAKLTPADALLQARLARICRATDYDFKKKKVILWNPSPID